VLLKRYTVRQLSLLIAASICFFLFSAPTLTMRPVSARSGSSGQAAESGPKARLAGLQSQLKQRLTSGSPDEFVQALAILRQMDEEGVLDLWNIATNNRDPRLKKEAWRAFAEVRPSLIKKQAVPQIAHIDAPAETIAVAAGRDGGQITFLAADATEYALDRLRGAGLGAKVLYDTLSAMERSRSASDLVARRLFAGYQAGLSGFNSEVRIAVVELPRAAAPAAGYSDWLGDPEDILMRSESFVAYLDILQGTGEDSIKSHVRERFTSRGYRLAGLFSLPEFSKIVGRFFPGRSFNAGSSGAVRRNGEIRPELANGAFHSYQGVMDEFSALATAHPDLAQTFTLGTSFEGRQILGLKITSNIVGDASSKPDVLITGCHHAREWISVEPPVYFANQLINGYASDDSIKYLVDRLQIWIVPVVNPDGLTFSQGSPNDQFDAVRLWRKNRRPIGQSACIAGTGVDLNRNYSYQWRLPQDKPCPNTADDVGASDDPNNETYRGPEPESELEVKALDALTGDPNRNFRARLDYHNFQQLILYPWGYQSGPAPDANTLSMLGQKMSNLALATSNVFYKPEQSINLYITTGVSIDYAYAVDKIAVPIVVELRPQCCNFNVDESEIAPIDQESWAGARALMDWAAGPPILQSVQAYEPGQDGTFSIPVYSAHWVSTGSERKLQIDTLTPGIASGPLQLRLQFSKPMDGSAAPSVTLGRGAPFLDLKVASTGPSEGWQKTTYTNDTWIGEAVIPRDSSPNSEPWTIAAACTDTAGLNLDGDPSTVAGYPAGSGGWQNYEDQTGSGNTGGTDVRNLIPRTLPGGIPFISFQAPVGGERLAAGDTYRVVWAIPALGGFALGQQRISLSTDAGASFSSLADNLPATTTSYLFAVPNKPTTQARIQIQAAGSSSASVVAGQSQGFAIGTNIGSGVTVGLVASEAISGNWSDPSGSGSSGALQLAIDLSITNTAQVSIASPFIRVAGLNHGNILLSRDAGSPPEEGGRQSITAGSDNVLAPGAAARVRLLVGLIASKKFNLYVDIYGVADGGSINAADSILVWHGKPRTN
jgi:hypothetical protein